jgi:hypothetical protein
MLGQPARLLHASFEPCRRCPHANAHDGQNLQFRSPECYQSNDAPIILDLMAPKKGISRPPTKLQIEESIRIIRGQRVMLDSDLARLYGVTTRRLNEQVARNLDRFPDDFAFSLTQQEFMALMSQNATSKRGRGGRRKLPWVFTEQGVAMLSSVLKSSTAVRVNIEIMRAFVRLRRLMATPGELVEQLTKLAETVQLHDDRIKVISQVLQSMIEKPVPPRRSIGFHVDK